MKLSILKYLIIFFMSSCMSEGNNMDKKIEELRKELMPGLSQNAASSKLKELGVESSFLPKSKIDNFLLSDVIREKIKSYKGRLSSVIIESELFYARGYQIVIEIDNDDMVMEVIISEVRS